MNKHKLVRPPLSHKKYTYFQTVEKEYEKSLFSTLKEKKIVQFLYIFFSYCIKYLSRMFVHELIKVLVTENRIPLAKLIHLISLVVVEAFLESIEIAQTQK